MLPSEYGGCGASYKNQKNTINILYHKCQK